MIKKHGRADSTLLFADTLIEDDDLYRFVLQGAAYLHGYGNIQDWRAMPILPGIEQPADRLAALDALFDSVRDRLPMLVRIRDGRTPWQVFEDNNFIGNSRMDACSRELKRELLDSWRRANCLEMSTVIYVGLDWTEEHRMQSADGKRGLRIALAPWRVEAPMCDEPLWDKCRMLEELKALNIAPPRLYAFGFPHNNCGGFCVKAGQAHFAHLLKTMPARYAFHEAQERSMRKRLGDFSIMKDRRGGIAKPLTMEALRLRIENGKEFDDLEWGGCGCAVE